MERSGPQNPFLVTNPIIGTFFVVMGSTKSKAAAGKPAPAPAPAPSKATSEPIKPPAPPVSTTSKKASTVAAKPSAPKNTAPATTISDKKFGVFQAVATVYGPGYILEVREGDYIVRLGNWQLAQGQSPTCYLQEDALTKINGCYPGSLVDTVYGLCRVESIRGDGTHIVKPVNWKLANATCATLYLQPDAVKLSFTPGFDQGDAVMTVYGPGYVESKREKDLVVKCDNWALAQGQSPTCYLAPESCVKVPGVPIGMCAKSVWGLVRINNIRRDGTHVCRALHWNLANSLPPTLFLAPEALSLFSLRPGWDT